MRGLSAFVTVLAVSLLVFVGPNFAQDKKGKAFVLEGKVTCAKCELKLEKKCTTVVVVKGQKNDVLYYFDQESHGKFHDGVCAESKNGTVEGTVTDDGKRKVINVKKITYK